MQNINLNLCHIPHEMLVTRMCGFACAQIPNLHALRVFLFLGNNIADFLLLKLLV